jgi:dTMP kinase
VPVEEALRRLHGKRDRIEREGRAFLERVADAYLRLAEAFPERIVTVDATLPKAHVADQVRGELRALA